MYLYHRVPLNMVGTVLLPLNRQKDTHPEIYEVHAHKYDNRRHLMGTRIPLLECLWNDVLFMMAVSPHTFCKAYYGAGFPRHWPMKFFEIPLENRDPSRMAVLTRMGMNRPDEYVRFDPKDLPKYAEIPPETFAYWKREQLRGNDRPLLYMHIPHILYKGSIDVSNHQIVEA